MATEIKYNGSVIASPEAGQTATLKCAGMKMESDVVVEVAEQTGSGGETGSDFIAENFPSDTWSDGEYTGTIQGIPVTMRYKYRTGNTDPKNIPFVGTMEGIWSGEAIQITNLADFYLVPITGEYRFAVGGSLDETMLFNPVVPIFFDLSNLLSALNGITVDGTLTATQCSMHNYEGERAYVTTAVTYRAESKAIESMGELMVKALHGIPQYCEWYYEYGSAYGGKDTTALANYDANSAVESTGMPMEVASKEEMMALLETADVGSVYKYVGETTYSSYMLETNTLYVVEEIEQNG